MTAAPWRAVCLPTLLLLLVPPTAAAETTTTPCPLGSVTVDGVALGVPTTPLDWCAGANTSVRPNVDYTMVGVTITPGAGDNFLSAYGRDLWKYLDIRSAVVPGTTKSIFQSLFGLTYEEYSAIPAVQSNPVKGINNQSIVFFTPRDLAKIWIVTTDGTPGVSPDVPTSHGGYASAAAAVAVAGQESGGQNPGAFTFLLAKGGRPQFNSPITALDPIFAMNPPYDDGRNGGFWQVSSFVTTPDVLPCFIAAGWQGSTMDDAKTAIIYNPFFQAQIAMFWATKRLGTTECTGSSNTPCPPNQPSCVGNDWTQDNPRCLAGALCKGSGIWNAPLVDCMFNILTGTDQSNIHANGFPTSVMAQHGAYLAGLDLLRAQPPFVPTAPSSWLADANFDTACQSMPRFVERPCDGDFPGYPFPCSTLPYWPMPTGNGRTCGGQDCLTYRQSSLGGFPIPGVPSATVVMVGTVLLPPAAPPGRRQRRLPEGYLEGEDAAAAMGGGSAMQQHHRRLPTINLNLDYSTGLCPNPPGPNAITSAIQFTVNWQAGPSFLEQLRAFVAAQASQGVTICSLDTVYLSYPPYKTCKALVKAERRSTRRQCPDDACRAAARQTYRAHLRACKRGYDFCRTTGKDQRAAALRACKKAATGPGFYAAGHCRRNATRTYKSFVGTC